MKKNNICISESTSSLYKSKVDDICISILEEPFFLPCSYSLLRRRVKAWRTWVRRNEKRLNILNLLPLFNDLYFIIKVREYDLTQIISSDMYLQKIENCRGNTVGKINFYIFAKEVTRLIDLTNDFLNRLILTENLLRDYDPKKERGLDKGQAKQWEVILANEKNKVNNLEAVVAFVGSVKAGKSTSINAIIGADVLPNRSDPMTTYPTLVRHKAGQHTPLLHFPLVDEFTDLVSNIKERLIESQKKTTLNDLFPSLRERNTAERILAQEYDKFSNKYEGKENILNILESINDLCRLASSEHIDLPFPAVESQNGAKFPIIDIQYHHISSESRNGNLSILDSPGPNEVGQGDRLRKIVYEQLSQASAVVVVCDFTKLKTNDEAELQDLVQEFLNQLSDRLFIFANKFDQRQSKDMDIDQTRQYLANNLFEGAVTPDRIFPVSSRRAFLANWARRELSLNSQLPSKDENGHTSDFGQQALGDDWEADINDINRLKRKADVSWEKSLFDDPLEHVIRMAYDNAALISLKGASSKLLDYCRTIDNFLKIRESVTTKQVKEVQKAIDQIESDIGKIETTRQVVREEMDGMIEDYEENIKLACNDASEEIKKAFTNYFVTGQLQSTFDEQIIRSDSAVRIRESITEVGHGLKKLYKNFKHNFTVSHRKKHRKQVDFPPGSSVLIFRGDRHRDEAAQKVAEIQGRLFEIFDETHNRMEQYLDMAAAILADNVQNYIHKELDDVLEQAKKKLEMSFNVTLNPPKPILNYDMQLLDETLDSSISEGLEIYKTYRKKEGWYRKPQRWLADLFHTKWGYEEIKKSIEVSQIDLQALRDNANHNVGHFKAQIQIEAANFVEKKLRPNVNSHFSNLTEYLEKFRGDLTDALEDKQMAANDQAALFDRIKCFENEIESMLLDAIAIQDSLDII